jgi:hypothetical protein
LGPTRFFLNLLRKLESIKLKKLISGAAFLMI